MSSWHRYFSYLSGGAPKELPNGPVWDKSIMPEWRYPLAVLAEATKELQGEKLHFYFTKNAEELPEYGNHVVSMLWQEERCKIPTYTRHIRGVVRCLQLDPFIGFRQFGLSRYKAVLTFEYLRDTALHARSLRRMRADHPQWPPALYTVPRVLTIPLGYHSQEELPQIPMAERKLDTFFAGEIHADAPRTSYRYWVGTSKVLARRQLWNVMQKIKQTPEWRIDLGTLGGGSSSNLASAEFNSYSQKMMNTRLCVAPRGSVAETFRMYEGLRAGCMVITNPLPPEPYLKNAPVIEVDNWNKLPALMKKYARDIDALEHYRKLSLEFWKNRLSEPVIGEQVAHFLKGCPGGCP